MAMPTDRVTWATISALVSLGVGGLSLTTFVLQPLQQRVEIGRENLIRALAERDARMDYLQRQIDELEDKLKNGN